ncbi:DNA mismatch repair PMS2 protein [Fusarium heterosporum]|uniref:DNA mismatch repair PMS2 protein n=1 Tax=Fusarium heterosporum TaxID=42747 RepID=A0A8H5WXX1_FUSHE|nr:DNA mismatch repair PMS2 protein [Fusarium heterosporum]
MSISALPPSTTHLLRSSSTIADPLSLVKELVDNGIDAGAKRIEITVAPNCVDKIQVRDNGCGIQLEDYDLLGRRSHTSKLRNFDDLHFKGGKTLGFRGEALASANCLATIKITTRTIQDPVASLLLLKRGSGGINKQQPVSGPVGTTVQAVDLFKNIPVRRQNAIKVSRKTLADIRRLLESYATALPHVNLSFKVSGNPSQSWSYSPYSTASTREAITQVFGHTLTAQLVEVSSGSSGKGLTETQSQNVMMTAFLPRPESDYKTVKCKGAFISVDSRPLSGLRGTGKKLFSILKSSLSKVSSSSGIARAPSSPFMQLSIQCSPGSYDPNISPLKDEVLFVDEEAVLECFQTLCDAIYDKKGLASVKKSQPLIKGGSNTQESTSKDEAYLSANGNESFTADQELIDSLNDGLENLLGGSSGPFGNGERTSPSAFKLLSPPKNNAQPGNRAGKNSAGESQTVEEVMRTRFTVNLSRKESNSSDLDGTDGLVPVQITPRKMASPVRTQLQSHSRGRTLTSSRRFEDIGNYFFPVRDEPVEIATDETATPENPQHESDFIDGNHRLPLKELTESDLNTFREEEDEETDDESILGLPLIEPDVAPSPRPSPRRTTGSLLPNSPFRPLTRPRRVPNPNMLLATLRTPPSSDPTRFDNLSHEDARRQSATNSSTRGQRPPRGNTIPSINRPGDHGLGQTLLLPGSVPTVPPNRRRSEQARYGTGLGSRRNTLTPSREGSSAHLKDLLHSNHGNEQPELFYHGPPDTEPIYGAIREPELAQTQDGTQWSRTLQTLLMMTPPPQATRLGEQVLKENCQVPDQVLDDCNEHFDSRPAKRLRRHSSVTTSQDGESDPRCLLIERQRISTEGGRLKRIASKRLPLETIPQENITMKLSIQARVQIEKLKGMTLEFMTSGRAGQGSAVRFEDIEEVEEVDRLFKLAVEAWLEKNPRTEVEYKLRSKAKGKSKG